MTDLSKEALDALTTWLGASDDMSRDELFAKAHEKCLEAADAIAALRAELASATRRMSIYEGAIGDPVSATGMIYDMAAKIAALVKENKALTARAIEPDPDARHERDLAVARAALDEAALLAHRGVTDGGMAKSMALFLDADEWAHYKDACLAYRDKILSLDPAQIVKDMEGKE